METKKMEKKKNNATISNKEKQESKTVREKCSYCSEEYIKTCLKCGNKFCEWHAGAQGYCYKCK
jgi:hypothetical protein